MSWILGIPFPPGWLQGVDRAGAEGLPGAHPPSLAMEIFNGDFQWDGTFNGNVMEISEVRDIKGYVY